MHLYFNNTFLQKSPLFVDIAAKLT